MSIRITCIKKDNGNHENPYIAISTLGWIDESDGKTGSNTRVEIYVWIKDKGGVAYVKDSNNNIANLVTEVSPKGTKFVKTRADNVTTDNLLKLDECKNG